MALKNSDTKIGACCRSVIGPTVSACTRSGGLMNVAWRSAETREGEWRVRERGLTKCWDEGGGVEGYGRWSDGVLRQGRGSEGLGLEKEWSKGWRREDGFEMRTGRLHSRWPVNWTIDITWTCGSKCIGMNHLFTSRLSPHVTVISSRHGYLLTSRLSPHVTVISSRHGYLILNIMTRFDVYSVCCYVLNFFQSFWAHSFLFELISAPPNFF